jgi:hypothetical protein
MIPENLTYEQLIKDMSDCPQTKGMSVLQHGLMVKDYACDLIHGDPYDFQWRIPDWFESNRDKIITMLVHSDVFDRYLIHHDCGKPYCRTLGDDDKYHFPDHANVSSEVWKKLFPDDLIVGELIKMDMDIHCLKDEGVKEFSQHPLAISLLLAGLSEIHANASMFGGIESTSFKIKWKQIDRRGRAIIENLHSR